MDRRDIGRLVRWAVDVTPTKFAEDAYGIDAVDEYIRGKYTQMHENFIMWIAGLDDRNRGRLANSITFNETEEE